MRIALNVWFANQPTTGSGQYLTHLLAGYAERYRDHQFLLCGHTGQCPPSIHASRDHGSPSSLPPHFTWWRRGTPLDRVNRHLAKVWFEQLTFPSACRRWQADVIHVPYWGSPLRSSIPVVVTVHDLIPALLPAYRKGTKGRTYTALVSAAARRANTILTDSESSRQDIVQHLGIPPTRVRTVHLAADQLYASQPSAESDVDVRDRYGLPPRYLLYLGGFDVRKNVPQLLRAFAQLEPNDVKLVIAGKLPAQDSAFSPDPRRVARELGIEERVQFTGWVDESDKPSLYGQAIALVFPSSYEGFGLPPLEALASGTPAIVSSAGSLPEVVGPGGLCVDVGEPAALTEAMHRLCTDSSLRARLQRAGLEHAQRFGWDRVTEATMSACIEVTGKNGLGMVQPRAEEASR